MGKKTVKQDKSKKRVEKLAENRIVAKEKTKPKPPVGEPKKLESGGAVESPINAKLILYDVWGNNNSGSWVNNYIRTETVIDIPKDADNEKIISILKEKGVLTEKANKDNVKINGDKELTLFFTDHEKGLPLFELQNIEEYEKKADGGNLTPSELMKPEYFLTTAPVKVAEVVTETAVVQMPTNAVLNEMKSDDTKPVENKNGELKLPDVDATSDDIIKKYLTGGEIHVTHLESIVNRKLKYEELVGTVKLRKCFLRQYYKVI